MKRPILLALLLACGSALAAQWTFVARSEGGKHERYIDVSSIRVTGDIRRAWFKSVYAAHVAKDDSGSDANKWWSSTVGLRAYNCSEGTSRFEAQTVYYEDGTNYSDPSSAFPTPWEPVVPDTVRSAEMQFICAWKPK